MGWLWWWLMVTLINALVFIKTEETKYLFFSGVAFGFLIKDISYMVELKVEKPDGK